MIINTIKPIHPFPARMASEIVFDALSELPSGSVVLDPMSGSGTVLRVASDFGHIGIGRDKDPLAVLLTKVWTKKVNTTNIEVLANRIIKKARTIKENGPKLPWIDEDKETQAFINFWFAERQKRDLRILSSMVNEQTGSVGNVLKVAMSRLIITKSKGASLARDVSHSRPHRVGLENDYDVFGEFQKSARFLAKRLNFDPYVGKVTVSVGDSRSLNGIKASSIDAVVTSPPYLNAVDYMRGHKLALVWLGYQINQLKEVRSTSIGAEKAPDSDAMESNISKSKQLIYNVGEIEALQQRQRRMIDRYALDIRKMMQETHRVLKPGGKAILVVGNSCLSGIFIKNTKIVENAGQLVGLDMSSELVREIPDNRRYLPMPALNTNSGLEKRMRTESVMTFIK